jgi:hypothetical protein
VKDFVIALRDLINRYRPLTTKELVLASLKAQTVIIENDDIWPDRNWRDDLESSRPEE